MTLREIIDAAKEDALGKYNQSKALLASMMGELAPATYTDNPMNIADKIILGFGADTAAGLHAQLGATENTEEIMTMLRTATDAAARESRRFPTVKSMVMDYYISGFKVGIARYARSSDGPSREAAKDLLQAIAVTPWGIEPTH